MRLWLRRLRLWGESVTQRPRASRENLGGLAGKWVAVKDGRVVEAQDTPDRVYQMLHERRITGATIFRVPAEDEPEMVGLG